MCYRCCCCCYRCCCCDEGGCAIVVVVAALVVVVAHRVVIGAAREVDAVRREVKPEDLLHVALQHLRRRVRSEHDYTDDIRHELMMWIAHTGVTREGPWAM